MSEDTDRDTEDISKQLNELKQWKQNIGLEAVISAEKYKKELDAMKTQSDQFKNELIETQKESRIYQERLEQIKLKQLKEDINIDRNEEIEEQSLESQLASINQKSKEQEMELNECYQEIQRLKMERSNIMRELNEYQNNMKQENKINKQLIELQLTLKNIKQENQSLIKDNDQYKEILTKLREKENNLKQKINENESTLKQLELECNYLYNQYEQEHDQRINEHNQYKDQIQEMEQISISSNVQKPRFLPEKPMIIPTISNSFRNSTRKILTSMRTLVLDVQNSSETLFATIPDTNSNEQYVDTAQSLNDADFVCVDGDNEEMALSKQIQSIIDLIN